MIKQWIHVADTSSDYSHGFIKRIWGALDNQYPEDAENFIKTNKLDEVGLYIENRLAMITKLDWRLRELTRTLKEKIESPPNNYYISTESSKGCALQLDADLILKISYRNRCVVI